MQLVISTVCLALTSAVIGNAYMQKQQFYPAVVYITKSNASMAVIYIQFFVIVFMFGKLLRKIFLGTLRAAEFEHLLERFWYALTETCLAFTVFRDDFNPRFVALFTVLLFLKSFHWLAEERVDFMERSPVLGWLFHIRVGSLLTMLGILDYVLLMHAYNSTLVRGPTVQLVFGFEYAILLTVIASTTIKYVLHAAEMRTDTPWENKAVFLLYTELVIGLIKVVLYLLFVVIMAKIYALPMFVFRPMFFTIRNFRKALNDVIMSRRAIRNMNTLYPDATPEELRQSDNICIICREDMVNHSKKLPCGHIFHTTCLRSWFQRQQTCPTCRLNILRAPAINSTAMPRPGDAANPAGAGAGAVPAGAAVPGADGVAPGAAAPSTAPGEAVATAAGVAGAAAAPGSDPHLARPNGAVARNPGTPNFADIFGDATGLSNLAGLPPPPPLLSPFMMQSPFGYFTPPGVPPPPMPLDLTTFSEEELLAMEGNLRQHIEERLKMLRNISLMVDSANLLMQQYQLLVTRLPPPATTTAATTTATALPVNSSPNPVYDEPSTSRAAAAKVEQTTHHQLSAAAAAVAAQSSVVFQQVTIEDLGADYDDDDDDDDDVDVDVDVDIMPSTEDNCVNVDNEESTELSELRKRRLKFLEERNSSPTTTTTTTITTTTTSSETTD